MSTYDKTFIHMNRAFNDKGKPYISVAANIFIRNVEPMVIAENGRNLIRFWTTLHGAKDYITAMCGIEPESFGNGDVYAHVLASDVHSNRLASKLDCMVHSPKFANKNIKLTISGRIRVDLIQTESGKYSKSTVISINAFDLAGVYDVKEGSLCRTLAKSDTSAQIYNQPGAQIPLNIESLKIPI